MQHIRFIIINILFFGGFLFLLSLLFPSQVHVSKTATIPSNRMLVKSRIADTANWKSWNDLIQKGSFTGSIQQEGDSMIQISVLLDGVQIENRFLMLQQTEQETLVNYTLIQSLPWYKPWQKLGALLTEGQWGRPVESSLEKLTKQAEKTPLP